MAEQLKVKLTYTHNDALRTEVVDISSARFLEILSEDGSARVQQANTVDAIGVETITRKLHYTEADGAKRSTNITYHVEDGEVVFDEFEPFMLRGFNVTKKGTKRGDMLAIDLGQQEFTLTSADEMSDVVNAVRRIYKFNDSMLSDTLNHEDEIEDEIDDEIEDNKFDSLAKPVQSNFNH
jgi:hypothetical protein